MFFALSKTLGGMVLPLPALLALLLLAVLTWRRRPKVARWVLGVSLALLWGLSTEAGAYLLLRPLERPYDQRPVLDRVDAIVVLGGSLDLRACDPGRPQIGAAGGRFLESVVLARRFPEATLVFSGGTAELSGKGTREAPLLKALAVQLGLPEDRVVAEGRSRNTRENAIESKRIVAERGATSVVLVTSAFHMRRAMGCFRAVGLEPIPYAADYRGRRRGGIGALAPDAGRLADSTSAVREYVGLLTYRMRGYTQPGPSGG